MTGEQVLDSLEYLDDDLIEAAGAPGANGKTGAALPVGTGRRAIRRWVRLAAACLCLTVGGMLAARALRDRQGYSMSAAVSAVQQWSADMTGADYFKDNRAPGGGSSAPSAASLAYPPYAAWVSLSGGRAALEAEGVIPEMDEHPDLNAAVYFNGDGSLYKVQFFWMRRGGGGLEGYSDLKLAAAPRELREISDVAEIALDRDGNVIGRPSTRTQRDGVLIRAEGFETGSKSLTWERDGVWYRAEGSFNDSYEDVTALLDWFWAHPLDLARWAALGEDIFAFSALSEHPEAFAGAIPDFAALGYTAETEVLSVADAEHAHWPYVWFDGEYARDGARVRWTVDTTMDGYDLVKWNGSRWVGRSLGRLENLTETAVAEEVAEEGSVLFDAGDCRVTLALPEGTAEDAWELIRSLQ